MTEPQGNLQQQSDFELPDDDDNDDDDEREAKEVPRPTEAALVTSYPPGSPLSGVWPGLCCLDCEV